MNIRLKQFAAAVIALAATGATLAGPGHPRPVGPPGVHGHPRYVYPARPGPGPWVVPAVTGGIVGAVIASQPRTVVVERPVRLVEPGSGTTYKRVEIFIPECNCYRTYDVPLD